MGNLRIMKCFSGIIFIGMDDIITLWILEYLCIAHPISVCGDDRVIYYSVADDISGEPGAA